MKWEKAGCTGALLLSRQQETKSIDIRFNVVCGEDGTINLQVEPIEFREEVLWLVDVFHAPDLNYPQLLLKGQTAEGFYISANNLYLTEATPQIRQSGAKAIIPVKLDCAELQVSVPNYERGFNKGTLGLIQYGIQGFRCFPPVSAIAEVGAIRAVGAANVENYNIITGTITIEAKQLNHVEDWIKEADDQLQRILDIFSLAGGRYLEWSRRSLFIGDEWAETVFRTPTHRSEPYQPIFHFINMQQILDLAVYRYNKEIKDVIGLGIAIEQF